MSVTEAARAALEGVDEVDWPAYRHPYGRAEDVPDKLRALLAARDTDEADDAGTFFVTYFVCQGVHYEDATVPAVPFLLRLLAAPGVSRACDRLADDSDVRLGRPTPTRTSDSDSDVRLRLGRPTPTRMGAPAWLRFRAAVRPLLWLLRRWVTGT
jgi:hypothetical protein